MSDVTKDLLDALKGLMALPDHRVDLRDEAMAARAAFARAEAALSAPQPDSSVWVLTSSYNDYDQHGEYFEAVFKDKPTRESIMEACGVPEEDADHILLGGGRKGGEYVWFNLRQEALAARLAELEGQEPVAWVYDWQAPEGLIKGWVETNRDAIPEDATNIRPLYARPVPAEPVNVEFGMRGETMFFKIGSQSFALDYRPDEQGEYEFMQQMLLSAFSRITPGVKTASEPVNARLIEALRSIQRYGLDTLSGRADGGDDDRAWQRAAVNEMTKRARIALSAAEAQQAELVDERVIDRTWVRFCGAFGDGPDAPES